MTRLWWDQVGERLYEDAVDHGVLYLSDNSGVVWNGLISVDESFDDDDVEAVYYDGIKIADIPSYGDFAASLKAYTYPDKFLEYEGVGYVENGLFVDDQPPKPFGLSFQTKIGNDQKGFSLGYKIHIIYNILAIADSKNYETLSPDSQPMEFGWTLTTVPQEASGYKPTAHVVLDSRYLPDDMFKGIQEILYGKEIPNDPSVDGGTADYTSSKTIDGGDSFSSASSFDILDGGTPVESSPDILDGGSPIYTSSDIFEGGDAISPSSDILDGGDQYSGGLDVMSSRLPSINELIDFVSFWSPKKIISHEDTGLAELVDGIGDLTETNTSGVFSALPTTTLSETEVDGIYFLAI